MSRPLGSSEVPTPRTVLDILGEGGPRMFAARIERMGRAMDLKPQDFQERLHLTTDIGKIGDSHFLQQVETTIQELQPSLVIMDPLYIYQGELSSTQRNEIGGALADIGRLCEEAEASLIIVDHVTKGNASDWGLNRLNGVGVSSWANSWVIIENGGSGMGVTDSDKGIFSQVLHVGGRAWGSMDWSLMTNIGAFDFDTMDNVGDIMWTVQRAAEVTLANQAQTHKQIIDGLRGWLLANTQPGEKIPREAILTAGLEGLDKNNLPELLKGLTDLVEKAGTHKTAPWRRCE
jgi:hypothetical protein